MNYKKHKCYKSDCPLTFKSSKARNMHAYRIHGMSKETLGSKYVPSEYRTVGKPVNPSKPVRQAEPVVARCHYCPTCGTDILQVEIGLHIAAKRQNKKGE